jgi:hypothetical protein
MRQKRDRRRQRRNAVKRRRTQSSVLRALTTSTLALPGLAGSTLADSAPEGIQAHYNYSHYTEDDISGGKLAPGSTGQRYEIDLHQVHLLTPIGDRWDLSLDIAYETMTGATPWYIEPEAGSNKPLQVMTGATIEDARTDVLASTNYYLTHGKVGASAGVSHEKDYLAFNGGVSGERHLREKTTTISGGGGFSIDRITPVDADIFTGRPDEENKQSVNFFAGLSQILGQSTQVQSTFTYQYGSGFLSDPYKQSSVAGTPLPDRRPDERHQVALLTRFRQRVEGMSGSLHADYNFYIDDWGVNAHTFEAAWHQSLFDLIRIIPSVRYYSQSQADFYAPFYLTARPDGLRSSDYRLAPFGALSYRVKAETRLQTWELDWIVSFAYERYTSSGKLALGSVAVENPGLVSFNLFSVGLEGRF